MKAFMTALFLCVLFMTTASAQMIKDSYTGTISVSGEAVVNVTPDKIIISFGIETKDREISVAKEKNAVIMKMAVYALKEYGVPDKDIQTDHLSIEPRWEDEHSDEGFIGFFVRNTLVVTISDASRVEGLVSALMQSGVNYLHGIDFQTSQFKPLREQARDMALKAAKEKAEKMAGSLGQKIGSPIQISEQYSGSPWSYPSSWSGWGYGRSAGMTQNVMQNLGDNPGEIVDDIALGKLAIRANVSVTFELL